MEYAYTAYTRDRKLVKGKLSAANVEMATRVLSYGGYQIINLKPASSFLDIGKLSFSTGTKVGAKDILLFSRQLALLLESGTDLVNSLELLQKQITNKGLKKVLGENNMANFQKRWEEFVLKLTF